MTTRLPLFTLLLAALAIASCGDDAGPNEPAACVSTSDGALEAAAKAHVRNIVVGDNASPKGEQGQADRIEVAVCRSSDNDGRATVTVLGLRDDSIRDVRHVMVLEKRNGNWVIVRDGDSYRCQQGRGQQDFEPNRCA